MTQGDRTLTLVTYPGKELGMLQIKDPEEEWLKHLFQLQNPNDF